MEYIKEFRTEHTKPITYLTFDFFGNRIASGSADGSINIWDRKDGSWNLVDRIQTPGLLITKLDWAHPLYGQLLAVCIHNYGVVFYEETVNESNEKKWVMTHDFHDMVPFPTDVSFSPHHLGLVLGASAMDGTVFIFTRLTQSNKLPWICSSQFNTLVGTTCLTWCKSHGQMKLAVGNEKNAQIWKRLADVEKWELTNELEGHNGVIHCIAWAPSIGRSFERIATGCSDGMVRLFEIGGSHGRGQGVEAAHLMDHKQFDIWRLEWNVTGTSLTTSADDSVIRFWEQDFNGKWVCVRNLESK